MRLSPQAVADGFTADQTEGRRATWPTTSGGCASRARRSGPDVRIAVDANQIWGVDEAIDWIERWRRSTRTGSRSRPRRTTSSGTRRSAQAVAPIRVATGEHVHNRRDVQAAAAGRARSTSCRSTPAGSAGVNENLAILLLAAKFGVPVCPHAGGVGLCEMVQHLAMFDFVAVSGTLEGRVIEYVDHLHEHFVDPVRIVRGRYAPRSAGHRRADAAAICPAVRLSPRPGLG